MGGSWCQCELSTQSHTIAIERTSNVLSEKKKVNVRAGSNESARRILFRGKR